MSEKFKRGKKTEDKDSTSQYTEDMTSIHCNKCRKYRRVIFTVKEL